MTTVTSVPVSSETRFAAGEDFVYVSASSIGDSDSHVIVLDKATGTVDRTVDFVGRRAVGLDVDANHVCLADRSADAVAVRRGDREEPGGHPKNGAAGGTNSSRPG